MADVSLISGPVEFDPSDPLPLIKPCEQCKGFERDGKRCVRHITPDREYCFIHDPTIDHMMQTLVERLDDFVSNCKNSGHATPVEILTISKAAHAFALLWDRKPEKAMKIIGWRMKGAV